jgi:hypothetical protein
MKRQLRRGCALAAACLLAATVLCGCGAVRTPAAPEDILATTAPLSDEVAPTDTNDADKTEEEDLQIDTFVILNDDATAINGAGASFENGRLTIRKAGVYSIKGRLTDGQIFVDTNDDAKVKLYLDGVEIRCTDSAPIYVRQAKKETQILLAKGSENKLSDNADRVMTEAQKEDNGFATAVIYSMDDLQIGGEGALRIEANFNKGIFSRDAFQLKGGMLTITARDDGIRGKDSVEISGGTVKIKCGGDGIRTSNENKGGLAVSGGDITVESTGDCLQAVGDLAISGGSFRLQSGGGYTETLQQKQTGSGFFGGFGSRSAETQSTGEKLSAKGIKAAGNLAISGGTFWLDCLDDALHADRNLAVSGGMFRISTNDDAVHADETVAVSGGEWIIEASYEGLEGRQVAVSGGALDVTAQDDGVNAAAPGDQNDMALFAGAPDGMEPPTDDSGRPQPPVGEPPQNGQQPGEAPPDGFGFWRQGGGKGGPDQADESCAVLISGGVLKVNAAGDGIDSNGSIAVSGGTVLVFGPTNDGNGALDYAGSCTVTGGSLCALGAAGMAQGASDGTSGRLEARLTLAAGDTLTVQDESGGEVYAVRLEKPAAHLALAGNMLQRGRTYTLLVNGSEAAAAKAE